MDVAECNVAEYSGLLACLQYALDHHHPRLRVVSDSELMVKQIQGKYKVNSPDLRPLWQEAKNRIAKLEAFEISHALRHKNKDADRLANEAMDRGMGRTPAISANSPGTATDAGELARQNSAKRFTSPLRGVSVTSPLFFSAFGSKARFFAFAAVLADEIARTLAT